MRAVPAGTVPGQGGRKWTQRVGAFCALPALVREFGADPDTLLRAVGLGPGALDDPDARVPYATVVELLARAAERTRCEHVGLLAGRMWRLATLGPVGALARNSPTVGAALEALIVHQHLNSEGALAFLLRRGDFVDFGYAVYDPGAAHAAQMYDAALAAGMNMLAELCGPGWKPYEVFVSHSRPNDGAQHRAFFKVTPRFDSEFSALRFPARDLARPVVNADPAARRLAEQQVKAAGGPELLQRVYRGLRQLMLDNRHSGDDLAQLLTMHRRTLNRRLKAEGTTFQQVLDEVRYEVSRDLLASSDVHLDDIAATLGYAAVTPFMRTFRRWSGTTPGRWRRRARTARTPGA
jgi:AraC-like DNA-binding protein